MHLFVFERQGLSRLEDENVQCTQTFGFWLRMSVSVRPMVRQLLAVFQGRTEVAKACESCLETYGHLFVKWNMCRSRCEEDDREGVPEIAASNCSVYNKSQNVKATSHTNRNLKFFFSVLLFTVLCGESIFQGQRK